MSEVFTEDVYPKSGKCPECNGMYVSNESRISR